MAIPVYSSVPDWKISGVNVFTLHLLAGLKAHGFVPHAVSPSVNNNEVRELARTWSDIQFDGLSLRWYDSPVEYWKWIAGKLTKTSPSIFLPGYDWFAAWKGVALPPSVSLVLILHSDENCYYEAAHKLGPYCDAIVAVSDAIAEHVSNTYPSLVAKLTIIPYGVPYPETVPARNSSALRPLRIVYAGRLIEYQKRVLDLARVATALDHQGLSFELTIVGDGPEEDVLRSRMKKHLAAGRVKMVGKQSNESTRTILAESDVFILTSEFEGLPVALLEAMSQGCVPVVTDIRSGIPQVLRNGENGFAVPVGKIEDFVARISELARDIDLRKRLSQAAHHTIAVQRLRVADMCAQYAALFHRICDQRNTNRPARPGSIKLRLPGCTSSWVWRLPPQVRRAWFIASGNVIWLYNLLRRAIRREER